MLVGIIAYKDRLLSIVVAGVYIRISRKIVKAASYLDEHIYAVFGGLHLLPIPDVEVSDLPA